MATESTSINEEILQITSQPPRAVHFIWEAQFTTPNGVLAPFKVMSVDLLRDYVGNVADELYLEVAMGIGTYQTQIVPYSSNLQVTLKRIPIIEGTTEGDLGQPIEKQTLRATLLGIASASVENNTTYAGDQYAGDLVGIRKVMFQLTDQALEQTRMQSFGTIYKQCTVGDAIKHAVTKIAQGLKVDSDHQIRGVQMTDPNNSQVYSHILVPHGTPAIDVPSYISHYYGAPYNAGIGSFMQGNIWYLYPLYDLALYGKAAKTLTVVNVPNNKMPTADRTYRTTYNQVILLATGSSAHFDPGDALQLNQGNGARYASADQTMEAFVKVKDNKATALRVDNVSEVKAVDRPTGLNQIQMGTKKITDNSFEELGHIAQRLGSLLTVSWVNSDPNLIFPGMPCRYLYQTNDAVFELKGIVLKTQTQSAPLQPGLFESGYRSSTAITMFLERTLNWDTSNQVTS